MATDTEQIQFLLDVLPQFPLLDIATALGCSELAVLDMLRVAILARDMRELPSVADVATKHGISVSQIYRILPPAFRRQSRVQDRYKAIAAMYKRGEPISDIRNSLQVSVGTIYRALRACGVPLRRER